MINIDYERDNLLSPMAHKLVSSHYLNQGETSPQEAYARAAVCFSAGDDDLAQRIYDYVSKGWFMYSSPVLSNAVNPGEKFKGLPISCFTTYVDDSVGGLCDHTTELRYMSVKGGGIGGHWSAVRSMNKITPGPVGFMHSVDADMTAYKQGKTRRGSYASYMDISHPDIKDFIKMRVPTGDVNRRNLNLHHGVNITDDFINAVDNNLEFGLVDPHSGEVKEVVRARELWELILETRFRTGEPYINYLDEANRRLHPALKEKGLKIHGSNLCNEIHLPTAPDRSGVCCLSSVNLARYDEWKDTDMVKDLIRFLDNVLQVFIDNAGDGLERAKYSAERERSLGLGAMGFHDYLQAKNVPWESAVAIGINRSIFRDIYSKAVESSRELAEERGEPDDLIGYTIRNAHLLAIAPNANSSIILGVSPSIEPRMSNAITQKTRVGSYLVRNPYLETALESVGMNTDEVWKSIVANEGSIQHLDLPDHMYMVFKTANEIDQRWVVDQARARQEFICQGQSVNLFFPAGTDKGYLNMVHRRAFAGEGIGVPLKGVYYLRTQAGVKTENVSFKVQRDALADGVQGTTECLACEG